MRRTKEQVNLEEYARWSWFHSLQVQQKQQLWNIYMKEYYPAVKRTVLSLMKGMPFDDIQEALSDCLLYGFTQFVRFLYWYEAKLEQSQRYPVEKIQMLITWNVRHYIIEHLTKRQMEKELFEDFDIPVKDEIMELERLLHSIRRKLTEDMRVVFDVLYLGAKGFNSKEDFISWKKQNYSKVRKLQKYLKQEYGIARLY